MSKAVSVSLALEYGGGYGVYRVERDSRKVCQEVC